MRKFFLFTLILGLFFVANATWGQGDAPNENPSYTVESLVEQPYITSIVWASDGRMFWTEKEGRVHVMSPDGEIQEEPVIEVEVDIAIENGLQSMALDPNFDENHYFYVFYTSPISITTPTLSNLIVRFTEQDGIGINPLEMLRVEMPRNNFNLHNGGRLRFGPNDGFFYVSIGDMGIPTAGQDFNALGGKIHRFAISGNTLVAAPGNPYPGNSVWVTGLRNTFAFAFDPETGYLFATENGPECDDEINLIVAGQNYGWVANVDCSEPLTARQASGVLPLITWTPTIAPTGIMIYGGEAFPGWQGQLFFCSYIRAELFRVHLNEFHTRFEDEPIRVPAPNEQRCQIELEESPEGYIYYTNIHGMFRIVPTEAE